MRRVSALLAVLSLAVTGCTFSSVDPDAPIRISGRALDASGRPLSGAHVLLFKQADLGEVLLGTVLAIGTLSTVCLLRDPPALCDKASIATADADGRYEFELKGSDTQGTLGTEATLNAVFSGPPAQGSTTISFTAKDTEITLPDARLWRSRASVSGQIGLSWSPLPRAAGRDPAYTAELFEAHGQSAFWSQPASGNAASIDPRILEDQSGAVAVSAGTDLAGGSGTGDVRASYLSTRLPVDGTASRPPSRGRPCAAVTGTARPVTRTMSACAATDGDLLTPAQLSGKGAAVVTGVVIDLGGSRPVDLVVARGVSGQLIVEVSEDGSTYRTVATGSGPTLALRPAGRPNARFVRLRSPAGLDESLLSELSVW
ncbi:hypothetical protein [Nocardioides sp.]|uniref:hypothetical protein n=1 Tax=Nocardioides sp. TaxID=35761 RepID=UPI0031FEFF77|nr:LigA protein [Nocardioides sp.]